MARESCCLMDFDYNVQCCISISKSIKQPDSQDTKYPIIICAALAFQRRFSQLYHFLPLWAHYKTVLPKCNHKSKQTGTYDQVLCTSLVQDKLKYGHIYF